jgi:hypothetical protein
VVSFLVDNSTTPMMALNRKFYHPALHHENEILKNTLFRLNSPCSARDEIQGGKKHIMSGVVCCQLKTKPQYNIIPHHISALHSLRHTILSCHSRQHSSAPHNTAPLRRAGHGDSYREPDTVVVSQLPGRLNPGLTSGDKAAWSHS